MYGARKTGKPVFVDAWEMYGKSKNEAMETTQRGSRRNDHAAGGKFA
jgi:hypothetical protein